MGLGKVTDGAGKGMQLVTGYRREQGGGAGRQTVLVRGSCWYWKKESGKCCLCIVPGALRGGIRASAVNTVLGRCSGSMEWQVVEGQLAHPGSTKAGGVCMHILVVRQGGKVVACCWGQPNCPFSIRQAGSGAGGRQQPNCPLGVRLESRCRANGGSENEKAKMGRHLRQWAGSSERGLPNLNSHIHYLCAWTLA